MGNVRGSRSEERRLPARTRAVSVLTIMEKIGATTPMDAAGGEGAGKLRHEQFEKDEGQERQSEQPDEHEAAYRAGDKAGMDEEGFGTDGKETEIQEDNQAGGGGRGLWFSQPGRKLPTSMARKETTIIT